MKATILALALTVSAVALTATAQACTYKSVQTTAAPMTVAEVPPAAPAPAPSTEQ